MFPKKLGIFGGTFDPIHLGHLHLAKEVLAQAKLDSIMFMPCCESGYGKKIFASPKQRLDMISLAIQPFNKFILDDREIRRGNISYTIDTLFSLRKDYPKTIFYLLMGAESFGLFDTWYRWQEIIEMVNFIVVDRRDECNGVCLDACVHARETELLAKKMSIADKVNFIHINSLPISATQIRDLVATRKNAKTHLPENVLQYILENGLYKITSS